MKAVVLVGGEGTRLRPLTSTIPKPAVTLVDRPFLAYMLEWLRGRGRRGRRARVRLPADELEHALGDGSRYGVRLTYIAEPEPRGTGGACATPTSSSRAASASASCPQRRRPDGHRPARADRAARAQRRAGHARARAGRGPERVRARAHRRGRPRARLPREAEPRRDRHRPDQRRRVRARALGARPDRRRTATSRSSARSGPCSPSAGCAASPTATPTGWTSARPTRYLQGTADILSGRVRTHAGARLDARARGGRRALRHRRRGARPGAARRRRARSARARSSARRRCSGPAS